MDANGLESERVYREIREGVRLAFLEALSKSYNPKAVGDRLADAVRDGALEALRQGEGVAK